MTLIVFSDCLHSLDADLTVSSSQKYELQFAKHLSTRYENGVLVLSSALPRGQELEHSGVRLVGIGDANRASAIKHSIAHVRNARRHSQCVILFYGYDLLRLIGMLLLKWMQRVPCISFVFDTHVAAISHHSRWRRSLLALYFGVAIGFLNLLDGFLLFQEEAAKELRLKRPYLVIRPGADVGDVIRHKFRNPEDEFIVTYIGSLMEHNGIRQLLAGFGKCDATRFRLRVFGTGPLAVDVRSFAQADCRVHYGGLINGSDVAKQMRRADLLVCLRDTDDYVSKFAFPSKLWECMASGVPTMASDLGFDEEFSKCVVLVSSLQPESIACSIRRAAAMDSAVAEDMGTRARSYVSLHADWANISQRIADFINWL